MSVEVITKRFKIINKVTLLKMMFDNSNLYERYSWNYCNDFMNLTSSGADLRDLQKMSVIRLAVFMFLRTETYKAGYEYILNTLGTETSELYKGIFENDNEVRLKDKKYTDAMECLKYDEEG